jgi:hypothetical protein
MRVRSPRSLAGKTIDAARPLLLATLGMFAAACSDDATDPTTPGIGDAGVSITPGAPTTGTMGALPGTIPGTVAVTPGSVGTPATGNPGTGAISKVPGADGGTSTGPLGDAGGATSPAMGVPNGSEANYKDPGKGAWEKGTPDECGIDVTKLADTSVGNYAIFRRGKLCHMKGSDDVGDMFSATKTLGGVMIGRAAYLTRDVPKTGPGTGTIVPEDKAVDWLGSVGYNRAAALTHVMSMCGHSADLSDGKKTWAYDTVGSTQINTMISVTEKAIKQVPNLGGSAQAFLKQEVFDRLGMSKSSWSPALGISSGWRANLTDMGKLGTLLAHDGWYGGERLVSREWVYRMSHPAFEDANTSYGHLSWLNHRGNAAGIGGNISTGANAPEGDPCAPAAFWPSYPHGLSEAKDCRAKAGAAVCKQQYDVGIFSAQGLGGQFVVVHPGLDLVIVARNFSGGDGPLGLWRAVRPGLVAKDPKYKGDEMAFCADYGAGNYAPDLVLPRTP